MKSLICPNRRSRGRENPLQETLSVTAGLKKQPPAVVASTTLALFRSVSRRMTLEQIPLIHYNFVRPHGALKFGREVRTPAMHAGLTR